MTAKNVSWSSGSSPNSSPGPPPCLPFRPVPGWPNHNSAPGSPHFLPFRAPVMLSLPGNQSIPASLVPQKNGGGLHPVAPARPLPRPAPPFSCPQLPRKTPVNRTSCDQTPPSALQCLPSFRRQAPSRPPHPAFTAVYFLATLPRALRRPHPARPCPQKRPKNPEMPFPAPTLPPPAPPRPPVRSKKAGGGCRPAIASLPRSDCRPQAGPLPILHLPPPRQKTGGWALNAHETGCGGRAARRTRRAAANRRGRARPP